MDYLGHGVESFLGRRIGYSALRPAIEEMFMTDPPCFELHTYFDNNQDPVKFVLITTFRSSSLKFNGVFTVPEYNRYILILLLLRI